MKGLLLTFFMLLQFIAHNQTIVHSEDFSSGLGTWTGVDVLDPIDVWTGNGNEATMNGWGEDDDEDWLISPQINMDNQAFEYFIFDYNDAFGGNLLELYYSADYNGGGSSSDVGSATWTNIPLRILDINSLSCFSNLLMRHPAIDISGITGNVYFAFKYTGTSSTSKNYKIDNIRILAEYYGSIHTALSNGTSCGDLKTELYNVLKNQYEVIWYTSSNFDVWDALLHTDRHYNDAGTQEIVWDMFTDRPSATGEPEFDHCNDRDGGSCPGGEGQCYNREHTFPRSWWGGGTSYPTDTINTDLHHITPSDRLMNTYKLNYPPGIVTNVSSSGSNGFKVGTNPSYPCGTSYFEPIDEYKGDYARMFFYIVTRYENDIASWSGISTEGDCALDGTAYPAFEPFMLELLYDWHINDPVSAKEIDRNNAIYSIQGNRNPYIDNPEWVSYIWGDNSGNSCSDLTPGPCTPNTGSETITSCNSYTWAANSSTYNTSGIYTATLTNSSGCDSTVTLNLTINNSTSGSETITACSSYTWSANSTTYTTSGIYTATLPAANGCDSIATLNLTINNPTSGSETIAACGSYSWSANSTTYTASGVYTAILPAANGCDSTATLNLTINNPTSGSETIAACSSYTWSANSTTYTASGVYTAVIPGSNGCDSTATLNLTINNPTSGSETITACSSYTWSANSTTYTASGVYTATLPAANGCDSIATLNLTINNPTSGSENVTACSSYTWSANSTTYTASGVYTATLPAANGCDSIATLNLTINNPTSGSENVTACVSYTWSANSTTYTTSGVYTAVIPGSNGCDSTATLNLTMSTVTTSDVYETACDTYTWATNSSTYTSSGDYAETLTSSQGCDSIVTLHLTINNSTSSSENVTACDSYTWTANSTTYTASGIYTATLPAANGCDSIATLNLTINNSTSGSENVTACSSYTWSANSTTYTASGIYTATLPAANGCDSIATLNLTINNPTSGSESIIACDSYTWTANSTTYTTSGIYTAALTAVNGCDSIATLNLTINTIDLSLDVNSPTLTSNTSGATYQWIDCSTNTDIDGETNQSYTASSNGNYAVVITTADCMDTSECIVIGNIGMSELLEESFNAYPNPSFDKVTIESSNVSFDELIIYDELGRLIEAKKLPIKTIHQIQLPNSKGIYFIELNLYGTTMGRLRLVKE